MQYDRSFLLQLQFVTESIVKPAGLPKLPDVILDAVTEISLFGYVSPYKTKLLSHAFPRCVLFFVDLNLKLFFGSQPYKICLVKNNTAMLFYFEL